MTEAQAQRILEIADDELVLGWRDSEWTGIAPFLEEDVASSWIARHHLYETADAIRIEALKEDADAEVAGLAAKIDREEVYHRMHAEMWIDRLGEEPRLREALERLWPYALGLLEEELRPAFAERVGLPADTEPVARGTHTEELAPLWDEMTQVRRSVPGATW